MLNIYPKTRKVWIDCFEEFEGIENPMMIKKYRDVSFKLLKYQRAKEVPFKIFIDILKVGGADLVVTVNSIQINIRENKSIDIKGSGPWRVETSGYEWNIGFDRTIEYFEDLINLFVTLDLFKTNKLKLPLSFDFTELDTWMDQQ